MTWLQAMALWSNEVKDFVFGARNNAKLVGHYTQVSCMYLLFFICECQMHRGSYINLSLINLVTTCVWIFGKVSAFPSPFLFLKTQ